MLYRDLPITRGEGEAFVPMTRPVVEEIPFSVTVNGRHALTAMTSPTLLREFIVGYLYTERIVNEYEEIESIRIEGNSASVLTKKPFTILTSHKTVLSGCGGSTSFLDAGHLPKIQSNLILSPEVIRAATKETLNSDLHRITGGIHLVGLFDADGQAIRIAEDIGRHNALDRVVGHGLLEGVDFSWTFAVCSGRISSEMVRKCLMANIPVIVSRGATTTAAVEAAEVGGLTIVGFVRSRKMNIYTGRERVRGVVHDEGNPCLVGDRGEVRDVVERPGFGNV